MAEEENVHSAPVEPSAPEVIEAPAPAPTEVPKAGEGVLAPTETSTAQPTDPTAQMGRSEPLPEQSEPLRSAPEAPAQPQSASAPVSTAPLQPARDIVAKARAVIQSRKRKKLDRILEEIAKRGNITNDEVEKLLHVSDATATRYLSQLEKEGKIQQVGKTGHAVKYQKL